MFTGLYFTTKKGKVQVPQRNEMLSLYRSSHRRCSIKIDVLKNYSNFTGKDLCQSLFFNEFAGLGPAT